MDQTVAQSLSEIVSRPLGPDVRERATWHLLDWIACAALGASAPLAAGFLAVARGSEVGPCLTLQAGLQSAETAAFANGALGNIFEMDDIHRTSIVHAGDVVIPAALAASQQYGASGRSFLESIVAGYEAAIRIGTAAGAGHYERWYNTATCGTFGAAVAAGRAMGLNCETLAHALAHAGMQSTGLWQCRLEPGSGKQLATANAALAGLQAAKLAQASVEGPLAILEGPLGFFATLAPEGEAGDVLKDPEGDWSIWDVSFKPWPACRHAHPVIEAALNLRGEGTQDESGDRLEAVEIETYAAAIDFCDDPAPDTSHRGRFSLQHAFAVTWLRGTPWFEDFEPRALSDPEVHSIRQKVKVAENPSITSAFPHSYGARVAIRLSDGTVRETLVKTAKGDPENPMSELELTGKAELLLERAGMTKPEVERLLAAIRTLDEAVSLTPLAEALKPLCLVTDKEKSHAAE